MKEVCEIFFWRFITNDFIMTYSDTGFGFNFQPHDLEFIFIELWD